MNAAMTALAISHPLMGLVPEAEGLGIGELAGSNQPQLPIAIEAWVAAEIELGYTLPQFVERLSKVTGDQSAKTRAIRLFLQDRKH